MKYNTIAVCNNTTEAHLIKGRLENEGIPCFITNENISSLLPFSNSMLGTGIQVNVREEDREEALKILESDEESE